MLVRMQCNWNSRAPVARTDNDTATLKKNTWKFLIKQTTRLPCDLAVPPLGVIHSQETYRKNVYGRFVHSGLKLETVPCVQQRTKQARTHSDHGTTLSGKKNQPRTHTDSNRERIAKVSCRAKEPRPKRRGRRACTERPLYETL